MWIGCAVLVARGGSGLLDDGLRFTGLADGGLTGLTNEDVLGSAHPSTNTIVSTLAIDSIFLVGGLPRLRRATEWVNSEDPALERDADQTTVRGAAACRSRLADRETGGGADQAASSALRESGIEADLTQDTAGAGRRQPGEYDAVAFGRAVGEHDRARMRDAFRAANHAVAFVDGLAPITPLVAQFEQALGSSTSAALAMSPSRKVESSSSFAHRPAA